jgi:predicted amidophosphoribosyltransferase
MQGAFQAKNNATQLAGKHVLLIDDVMTTSSTLTACADALRDVPDIKFSFLTVAVVDH